MCWAMYLFTDNKIEEKQWNAEDRQMYIENIKMKKETDCDVGVLNWDYNNKNIYYIGSSQGCGCGWQYPYYYSININKDDEKNDINETIKDRNDLYKLLKTNNFLNSYIIVCWEGDQGKDIIKIEKLNIEKIINSNFNFEELIKYILE
jgi:hypothetical protein